MHRVAGVGRWLDLSGAETEQSSTADAGGEAARAVDGNADSQYSGNSCTLTKPQDSPSNSRNPRYSDTIEGRRNRVSGGKTT